MQISAIRQVAATMMVAVTMLIASAAPSLACACCGTWKVVRVADYDVLNIRSGPGAYYDKVGAIPSGSGCVIKTGPCRNNWCPITYAQQSGWVSNAYLGYVK